MPRGTRRSCSSRHTSRVRRKSIAYAAHDGVLLDAIRLEKRAVTSEGKTWAGQVYELDVSMFKRLASVVADLNWTGGAEVECVRDDSGRLHVIDWNPRFPAWIHGCAIAGHNLPARLISAASGLTAVDARATSPAFTRVVHEIPARFGVPRYSTEPTRPTGKHPSGMPELSRRMSRQRRLQPRRRSSGTSVVGELASIRARRTPARQLLPESAAEQFTLAGGIAERLAAEVPFDVGLAYSVKTDPDRRLLSLARSHGLLAECISQGEVKAALAAGWHTSQIVVNGPGKHWGQPTVALPGSVGLWFCDSVEELAGNDRHAEQPSIVGVRLQPPGITSRFGVALDDFDAYRALVGAIAATRSQGLATHFHFPASTIGSAAWLRAAGAVLEWSRRLEINSGRALKVIDFGGGWAPDQFETEFEGVAMDLVQRVERTAPGVKSVIFEPGKALVQSSKISRVART